MSITSRQITLIQTSFSKVEPIADQAAEIFYRKLFEYDPSLRSMFRGDRKEQGRKLMSVLKAAVVSLNNLDKLVPVLHQLAERHVSYGVKPEDYTPVGNALLYTLKQGLGEEFTPEHRKAWSDVFRLMANVMRQHSYADFDPQTFKNTKTYNRKSA